MAVISLIPQYQGFEIWKGDDFTQVITATISGTPVNFTGYTLRMSVRNSTTNDVALQLETGGSGITATYLGVITISMSATQTDALVNKDYKYDLEVTDGSGIIRTYLYGPIAVLTDITGNA